jgi:hypothetical protein
MLVQIKMHHLAPTQSIQDGYISRSAIVHSYARRCGEPLYVSRDSRVGNKPHHHRVGIALHAHPVRKKDNRPYVGSDGNYPAAIAECSIEVLFAAKAHCLANDFARGVSPAGAQEQTPQ